MKMVCSGCEKEITSDFIGLFSDEIITHGMCDQCYNNSLWPNRPELTELLDTFDVPVLAIDPAGRVSTANRLAQTLLQKELSDIAGFQGGTVFECVFAKLPEGCGNTMHCDGCTIRKTVMDTFKTGKGYDKVQAGLTHGTTNDHIELQCLISTEKVNDVVLLKIDTFGNQT